jgi:hypothetical protein
MQRGQTSSSANSTEQDHETMDIVEELKAIEDIRQLKSRYFRYLDTKNWDGMASIFCRNAVFDLRAGAVVNPDKGGPGTDTVLHGRAQIVNFLAESLVNAVSVHHGHGHEVWIDSPVEARGVIAMEDIIRTADTGALFLHGHGHYEETYKRDDGEWRIARSKLTRLNVIFAQPPA